MLHLTAKAETIDAPGIALALATRGLSLRAARGVATRLTESSHTVVALPNVEDAKGLSDELTALGVEADLYGAPRQIDVRAIREGFGLSQDDFALTFGLDPASVRNWEQGRSKPDTATRSFLLTIRTHPEIVRDTLRRHGCRRAEE